MAGVTGLDPMPRTLREMVWAAQGKEYAEWERLSALLCLLANANRDPKKRPRPFTPHDFFRRPGSKPMSSGRALTGESLRALKGLFVKKRD